MSAETLDHLLRTTAAYGLAFVVLAVFLGIMLWGFWHVVRHSVGLLGSLREWLPQWFQAQIKQGEAVVASVDTLAETLGKTSQRTHEGVLHAVAAAHRHVTEDKPNEYSEEVKRSLRNAKEALE